MSSNPISSVRARLRLRTRLRNRLAGPALPRALPADDRLLRHYRRVGRLLLGPAWFRREAPGGAFTERAADRIIGRAQRNKAYAMFADKLARGDSLETAHVATVRSLIELKQTNSARALSIGVEQIQGGENARWMGVGLVVHQMKLPRVAWTHFAHVPAGILAAHVPIEAAECAFADGSPEAAQVAVGMGAHTAVMSVGTLVELAGLYHVFGHRDDARRLLDEAADRGFAEAPALVESAYRNLRRWTNPEPVEAVPSGDVSIGILDYHQPDYLRSSINVGDYVQTLSILGNLARFPEVRFTGPDGVGELVEELKDRVAPDLRIPAGPRTTAHLLPISRDFSEGDPVPPGTWLIAFGWHMHPTYRVKFSMPYHAHLRPIFASFHIYSHQILDDATIDYLRAHGPIGCRDWTTVDMLLSVGVDAFFTGCVTSTVGGLFPALDQVDRRSARDTLVVDCPSYSPPAGTPVVRMMNEEPQYRDMSLTEGVRAADELLRGYQAHARSLVTSRLHAYLPAVSLGLEVDFRPNRPGDIRFDGLTGMTAQGEEFRAMQRGIRGLLDGILTEILAGSSEEEVYSHWRETTAPLVEQARQRLQTPVEVTDRLEEIAAAIETLGGRRRLYGPHDRIAPGVTDVSLSLDQNLKAMLPTTVESLVANASGPVRLWITTRGLDEAYFRWFSDAFPSVPITFLDFTGIEYGDVLRMFKHISITTMDRLILPEVLTELDRLVYVDIDTVTEGDVCELAAVDLGESPLAAKNPGDKAAFLVWRDVGNLLGTELASELRRTMAARHSVLFHTLNAGVLVLDLARMRADGFVRQFLPMAARYGLNDQDILNAYAGPHYLELDQKWNAIPMQEVIRDPGIVHYAGGGKPWGTELVPYGEHWKTWQKRVDDRVGPPPE